MMQMIQAAGGAWPLETFLDAHRFVRCEGPPPEIASLDFPLRCVTRDLEIVDVPARHAPWGDVLAYRAPDLSPHFDECEDCGGVTTVSYQTGSEPQTIIVKEHCAHCDPWCLS